MLHQLFGSENPWLAVAIAILVVHTATLVYAWLRRPDRAESSTGSVEPTVNGTSSVHEDEREHADSSTADDEFVRCRDCGAENEAGYRFCRTCVTELPGSTGLQPQPSRSSGRFIR